LTDQIADARLALESTLDDLTLDVAKAADLRRWVKRYPWPAIGVALVAGFTASHFILSKKRNGNTDLAAANEAAATEDDRDLGHTPPKRRDKTRDDKSSDGWRSAMIAGLFDILRLAVTQLVAASMRQASRPATVEPRPAVDPLPDTTERTPATDAHLRRGP
jgi:hypothetical protein